MKENLAREKKLPKRKGNIKRKWQEGRSGGNTVYFCMSSQKCRSAGNQEEIQEGGIRLRRDTMESPLCLKGGTLN